MFTANCKGTKVMASEVARGDGPFACSGCGGDVVLKAGPRVIEHFAHKSDASCSISEGESAEHMRVKADVFRVLSGSEHATKVEMERDLGVVRPDVSGRIRGARVAVEVQRSNLSEARIAFRSARYASLGIAVIWILTESLDDAWDDVNPGIRRFSPRPWHLWLHAAYFGRVYLWREGVITPVHFSEFWLWREGREGYSSGGHYPSKRWRTPVLGPRLSLADDFRLLGRKAWTGGKVSIPQCLLWADGLAPWWGKS